MKYFTVLCLLAVAASTFAVDWSRVVTPAGFFNSGGDARITGGEEVVPHSIPYQVGLFLEMEQGTAFCGGSLISDEWVLTAAHCGEITNITEVVLGAHEIRNEQEPTQVHLIATETYVHPNWSRLLLINDIALIHLPEKVQLNENIATVRLPSRSQINNGVDFSGMDGLSTGWGKDHDNATGVSPVLRQVVTPIVTNEQCIDMFGILGSGMPIFDTTVCIDTTGGKSTCNGDSGGPLVIFESDQQPTEVGLTSFGLVFGCEKDIPAVFTRTSEYVSWINEVTGIPIRD